MLPAKLVSVSTSRRDSQVPDLERVVMIPGLHRQVAAVGTEPADHQIGALRQSGQLEQHTVIGDTVDDDAAVVTLDHICARSSGQP